MVGGVKGGAKRRQSAPLTPLTHRVTLGKEKWFCLETGRVSKVWCVMFPPRVASTVESGFRELLKMLTPSDPETDRARRHRASIERCLKANFSIDRFFRTGSFGNGTSIRGFSDVDYFASIPMKHLRKNSRLTLAVVANALRRRFSASGVRVSTPAVVLPFGSLHSEWTEVVPAVWTKEHLGSPVYGIADGKGGWIYSCPEAHNAYVTYADSECGSRVRPLVRFVKAVKYKREIPVSSFYLELAVAEFALRYSTGDYANDIRNFLRAVVDAGLPAISDPTGVSAVLYPSRTPLLQKQAMRALRRVDRVATKALEAEERGQIATAFQLWRLILGRFPIFRRRR